jgi:hypothetical protein
LIGWVLVATSCNGTQEADGSIPFSSTTTSSFYSRARSELRNERVLSRATAMSVSGQVIS